MAVSCQQVIEWLEALAPKDLAEEWDNVGLQVGDPRQRVNKILVALDLDEQVLQEALEEGVQMVVTHHPLIFRPLKNLRFDQPQGDLLRRLVQKEVAVYAAHTNLDAADEGVNRALARILGLSRTEVLGPGKEEKLYKIVVFIPKAHEDGVREALSKAGAGWIGNYSDCTFQTEGTGTFKALEGANPFLGQVGQLERAEEIRMETIVPQNRLSRAVKAMIKAHPYEEVAYDIYPLANPGKMRGLGLVGELDEECSLGEWAAQVKEKLKVDKVRVAGELNSPVRKVAVCGGSGASLITRAAFRGADVLVTGDLKYHEAQEALAQGIGVIDAGHYATEAPVLEPLAAYLRQRLQEVKGTVPVLVSQKSRDPLQYL